MNNKVFVDKDGALTAIEFNGKRFDLEGVQFIGDFTAYNEQVADGPVKQVLEISLRLEGDWVIER